MPWHAAAAQQCSPRERPESSPQACTRHRAQGRCRPGLGTRRHPNPCPPAAPCTHGCTSEKASPVGSLAGATATAVVWRQLALAQEPPI